MAFELPALNFSHSALAGRGMSQETLELHHDKHHQAYVTALNGFVEKNADLQNKTLEEIVTETYGDAEREGTFNQAGQQLEPYSLFGMPSRRKAEESLVSWRRGSPLILAQSTPSRRLSRLQQPASLARAGLG